MDTSYIRKRLKIAETGKSEAIKTDALYRLGTHMDTIMPIWGEIVLTDEEKDKILVAARQALS